MWRHSKMLRVLQQHHSCALPPAMGFERVAWRLAIRALSQNVRFKAVAFTDRLGSFALVGATSARPERSTLRRVSGNPPGMERGLPRTSNVAGPLSWHRTPPVSCARFASLNQQYSKLRQYAAISGELANLARRAQSVA